MDCGSDQHGKGRVGYRPFVAAGLVVAALVALGAVGYASVRTLSDYTYGYSYAYEYQYGESHLIVIKHVVNDDGGGADASHFTIKVTAGHPSQSSFAGSESGTTVTVDAGSYSVDEDSVSGYTKTIGADCSGTIANGQTKTCTITNDDQPAHLIVIKHEVNLNGGKAAASQF